MRGLRSILSPFPNEFNKFNNIGARMLDFYDMNYLKSYFGRENVKISPLLRNVIDDILCHH